MMRRILLSILFITLFTVIHAQRIEVNKVDDFTGKQVIYTSWAKFFPGEGGTSQMDSEVRFRHEHDRDFMQIKIVTGTVTLTFEEDAQIDFKTDRGIYSFSNLREEISGRGKGIFGGKSEQMGMTLQFTGDFSIFLNSKVEKVRYHFAEGYYDVEVPARSQRIFQRGYGLIVDEKGNYE